MDPYLGEIRMVGFNFAPQGWFFCNGQLLAISQYTALFSLLGTTYGGNGQTTFGLPNLQGRVAVHQGQLAGGGNYTMGETAGAEQVTLITQQMPIHNHIATVDNGPGSGANPTNAYIAQVQPGDSDNPIPSFNTALSAGAQLNNGTIGQAGGSQPHENRPPFQVVNFIIAYQGIFPPRS